MDKPKKPTRKQLLIALNDLTKWATGLGSDKNGNPYGKPEVRKACELLANDSGKHDFYDWNT